MKPAVFHALRLLLAAVFIVAGVLKLRDPADFSHAIASFQLLPDRAINLVALALPPFEIFAAIALLLPLPKWQRTGALAIALMTLVFAIAFTSAFIRGLDVSCGCFGSWTPFGSGAASGLLQDLVLLAAAVTVYRDCQK